MCVYAQGLVAPAAQDNFFSDFISDPLSPIVFFLIFMLLSAVVIMLGVNKGIERLSKFLMPVLLVLTVGISIYTLTLPNAMEGVSYYLIPDFSKLSIWTFAAALGQLFFSMSIAMGIMVTYGSYTKDEVNLTKSVNQIEIFDTAVALLAGLMVVPAVYVFSGEEGLGASGLHLNSETDKPDRNSTQEAALLLFLPKVGRTQKSLIHSSENNRDRNDAGKYIPNGSHSTGGSLPDLQTFSNHSV